ncbi:MAG: recombination mediator RecR [Chitinispirillia bacterium]|nr:recombination mediator RecR [Chitinispirillia bacterium]MCL2241800.1 recombination mediator RecR [Chitinispirillia bacterium]
MLQSLEELVSALTKLPAIGRKSAWRLALYLMERPEAESKYLADTVLAVRRKIRRCVVCHNYSENEVCSVCASQARDRSVICIVEKPTDVFTIENAGRYRGLYHVLGGLLSPLNGITAEKLQIASLKERIRAGDDDVKETIIGLGGSGDAETTALYLARILRDEGVRVTRFARGLPAGLELEHVDQLTLTQALTERIDVMYRD